MSKIDSAARLGAYITTSFGDERVRAYVPRPLPPTPALRLEPLLSRIEDANRALGRLDGVTSILPDPSLFIYMYVRKEALFSSQIEGTQSSLSDLLLFESAEAPGVPLDDVEEVSNYVAAMNFGLDRLRGGFPLSLRLIREIHAVLLAKGRGSSKEPGEFRRTQNWIGGTVLETRSSCLHHPTKSWSASMPSNAFCMCKTKACRRSSKPRSLMSSSKPSIPFLMATAVLGVF